MRTMFIVVFSPGTEPLLCIFCIFQFRELPHVQTFLAHSIVERFDVTVFHELFQMHEIEDHAVLSGSFLKRLRSKLRIMIHGDGCAARSRGCGD